MKASYRKAFYKKSTRNTIEVSVEYCNTSIASFLFHKFPEKYAEVFGRTLEPITNDNYSEQVFGVIRKSKRIICVFKTDRTGQYYGDFSSLSLTNEQYSQLSNYRLVGD